MVRGGGEGELGRAGTRDGRASTQECTVPDSKSASMGKARAHSQRRFTGAKTGLQGTRQCLWLRVGPMLHKFQSLGQARGLAGGKVAIVT